MLSKEDKDKLLDEEQKDDSLTALNAIVKSLNDQTKLEEVVTVMQDLVKAISSKKMPEDRSERISIAIVNKFEEIHKSLRDQEKASLLSLKEGLLDVVKEIKVFHREVADSYKKINSVNFGGVEKVMEQILSEMKVNKEAEHTMDLEYFDNGDIKKVKIKRTR